MRTLAVDTSPASEQIEIALLRDMPAWRKLQLTAAMNRMVRTLALRGLRRRFPRASEAELRRRLADLQLGPDLALRVYGPLLAESE